MDLNYPILVLAPVIGLAAYCISHVIWCRFTAKTPYKSLAGGAFIGGFVTIIISTATLAKMSAGAQDWIGQLMLNGLTYFALMFCYFNFVNLNIASLRIRMLAELADRGGHMPVQTLLDEYNTNSVMSLRIQRLVTGGHLIERDGRYFKGRLKFLLIGRTFDVMRWIVTGKGRLVIEPENSDKP
jgi:hypothetical protein